MSKSDLVYNNSIHFWGRVTLAVALVFSFSIPVYFSFVVGYDVNSRILIEGLIFVVSFVGVVWIIEPISYFPILGSAGTYMSFLSGNIGNMRIPVVAAVHRALEVQEGTKKAELASIFGLVGSVLTNLFILIVVVCFGVAIVDLFPSKVLASFEYAVPGIIGAMIVIFASKMKLRHFVMTTILCVSVVVVIKILSVSFKEIAVYMHTAKVGVAAILAITMSYLISKS